MISPMWWCSAELVPQPRETVVSGLLVQTLSGDRISAITRFEHPALDSSSFPERFRQNQTGMGAIRLVGRDAEVAQLERALGDAVEHGGAMLVTGPAGIGKTALLNAISDQARSHGYAVLSVTPVESEADLPYAGLQQLLQSVLSRAGALPTPQKDALLTALGMGSGPPPDVFLVGLATMNLLDEVGSEGPLLVVVDDLSGLTAPRHRSWALFHAGWRRRTFSLSWAHENTANRFWK